MPVEEVIEYSGRVGGLPILLVVPLPRINPADNCFVGDCARLRPNNLDPAVGAVGVFTHHPDLAPVGGDYPLLPI